MNNPEIVQVGRAGHYFRELKVIDDEIGIREKTTSGLTNCKRFASGLALVYSITSPFCIQSETIQKLWGSVETETPNKGKMLGWDRRFQPIISRQTRYVQAQ